MIILIFIAAISGASTLAMLKYGYFNTPSTEALEDLEMPLVPVIPSNPPTTMPTTPETLLWDTRKHSFHAVRVLCDNAGLSVEQKNLICACIYQESQFSNAAVNKNKNSAGQVTSTDWGICQVNDYWHIGKGKDFSSVEYVVNNPDDVVVWMIHMFKKGQLKQWVSYSSGAYKQWLKIDSPMWGLKT